MRPPSFSEIFGSNKKVRFQAVLFLAEPLKTAVKVGGKKYCSQ